MRRKIYGVIRGEYYCWCSYGLTSLIVALLFGFKTKHKNAGENDDRQYSQHYPGDASAGQPFVFLLVGLSAISFAFTTRICFEARWIGEKEEK